eukprot:PhM_4_TR13350/c0_g1_i1/m.14053
MGQQCSVDRCSMQQQQQTTDPPAQSGTPQQQKQNHSGPGTYGPTDDPYSTPSRSTSISCGSRSTGRYSAPRPDVSGLADPTYFKALESATTCEWCLRPLEPSSVLGRVFSTPSKNRRNCCECGGVFCIACTEYKKPVPERGFKRPVAVCYLCYNKSPTKNGARRYGSTNRSIVSSVDNDSFVSALRARGASGSLTMGSNFSNFSSALTSSTAGHDESDDPHTRTVAHTTPTTGLTPSASTTNMNVAVVPAETPPASVAIPAVTSPSASVAATASAACGGTLRSFKIMILGKQNEAKCIASQALLGLHQHRRVSNVVTASHASSSVMTSVDFPFGRSKVTICDADDNENCVRAYCTAVSGVMVVLDGDDDDSVPHALRLLAVLKSTLSERGVWPVPVACVAFRTYTPRGGRAVLRHADELVTEYGATLFHIREEVERRDDTVMSEIRGLFHRHLINVWQRTYGLSWHPSLHPVVPRAYQRAFLASVYVMHEMLVKNGVAKSKNVAALVMVLLSYVALPALDCGMVQLALAKKNKKKDASSKKIGR